MSSTSGQGSNRGHGNRPRGARGAFCSPNGQGRHQHQQNQSWSETSSGFSDTDFSFDQHQSDRSNNYSNPNQFKSPNQPPPRQCFDGQSPHWRPAAQSTPNSSQHNHHGHGGGSKRDRSQSGGRNPNPDGNQHYQYRRDRSHSRDRSYQSGYGSWNDSPSPYRNRRDEDPTVFLSKTLSSILRHNAGNYNLKLMKGGFIYVEEILQKVRKLHGFTVDDVIYVVQSNDKQRFTLEEDQIGLKIRANQGHTMEVEDLDLKPITSADDYPQVIHGTYYEAWESIKKSGLNRMKRNHIHFAPGTPGANGVISGMRSSCQIMIYLDLERALKDGLKFYISSNNVILSPGDKDGIIHPRYFDGVLDRRNNYRLDVDPSVTNKPGVAIKQPESQGKGKKNKVKQKNRDQKKQSISSESTADNSREPPSKKKILWTSKEELSGRSDIGKMAETTQKTVDTKAMANISENYGHESEDSDEDSSEDVEPDTINDIEVMEEVEDPEISRTLIDSIVSGEPTFIVIICRGDRLGQERGHIRQLAVGVNTSLYVFNMQSKVMMEEGQLKELLLNKKIQKVFSRVEEVSVSLINEYDILLNSVPIWDLEILYEKLPSQMKTKDNEALKKLNIEDGMFEKWSKTNRKSEERTEDLTQQAIMMYRMFEIFKKSLDSQSSHVKTIKTETYKKAIPSDDENFLSKKIKDLKLAEKEQKKKEKGTGQQAVGGSTHDKQPEHENRGGGGGGKNKKKKKRH